MRKWGSLFLLDIGFTHQKWIMMNIRPLLKSELSALFGKFLLLSSGLFSSNYFKIHYKSF